MNCHPTPRRFFAKALDETAGFTQRKLLVSAFMAVVVRCAFWWFAQVHATWGGVWRELWRDLLIVFCSSATVILGSFIVNLLRAPGLLDDDCQREITRLSEQLVQPDKAIAEHLVGLLAQVGETGKRVVQFVRLHDEIDRPHIKLPGLSPDDVFERSHQLLKSRLTESPDRDTAEYRSYFC